MNSPYYKHTSFSLASRISLKARQAIFAAFMQNMRPVASDSILDVGVTSDTSRPESNFFEKLYPFKESITCCGTEDASHLETTYHGMTFIRVVPGQRLPFYDKEFSIVFSNATLEHAGSLQNQLFFLSELIRVSRSFFIATPNRWCPMEFHTALPLLHWLPRKNHRDILRLIGHDYWCREENLRLLGEIDLLEMLEPWIYVKIQRIKTFGITTNLIAYRK